jgi:putative Mg2+ transporter-C (MgtC) family protein
MPFTSQLEILGEIVLAAVLGGTIGFERELARKPAGLRTHMLVASSVCLLVSLGNLVVSDFILPNRVNTDPIRIIEAVIVGISFLGAGTILKREDGKSVEGLTTSASILSAAAIGIGTALRLYPLVVGTTLLIIFINRIMNWVEEWFKSKIVEPGVD